MRYVIAPQAYSEIKEIVIEIKKDNELAAQQWHAAIIDKFSLLARYPRMGRRRDDLREGVHCFPFGKYLIFYDVTPASIAIVHVIHGARDVAQAMVDRGA